MIMNEASRGAGAQSVTVKPTSCGFDPHSRRSNIYLNLYFYFFALVSRTSAALGSATQHAMSPEFGRNSALQCAGYSVKLIHLFYFKLMYLLCLRIQMSSISSFN